MSFRGLAKLVLLLSFLLGAISLSAFASESPQETSALGFDLRYEFSPAQKDLSAETISFEKQWVPWLKITTAGRFSTSFFDLDAFEYSGGLIVPIWEFLNLSLRLTHSLFLADSTSVTHLLPTMELHGSPTSWLTLFFAIGWYERFTQLSKILILPTPPRNSLREHDFATRFGFSIRPSERVELTMTAGSFEELSIYNINNPYLQLGGTFSPGREWSLSCYGRYLMLLGFGRLDRLMIGTSLSLPLN